MIYEIPGIIGNTYWYKTAFKILEARPGILPGDWGNYKVKIVRGNGRSKAGEEVDFVYTFPHNFIPIKYNILNA